MNEQEQMNALDAIIAIRLGERKRKLDRMAKWEQKGKSHKRTFQIASVFVVAACMVAIFFAPMLEKESLSPLDELGIRPEIPTFRGMSQDMDRLTNLVENGAYEDAMPLCESILQESEQDVGDMERYCVNTDDEEAEYELELAKSQNAEIRWMYIYILVRLEKNDEAINQIKKYMKHSRFCVHMEEAKELKKALQNKK